MVGPDERVWLKVLSLKVAGSDRVWISQRGDRQTTSNEPYTP